MYVDSSASTESYDSLEYYDYNETESNVSQSCEFDYSPDYTMEVSAFVVSGICVNIVGVLGIAGNIVTMVIFNKTRMKNSTNFLFSAVAFSETLVNASSILVTGLPAIYINTGVMHNWYFYMYPRYTPFVYPIWMIAQTLAVYLTLAVTVERFVAIYRPLRVKSLCTYKRAQIAFIIIFISSIAYNASRFWEIESQKFNSQSDNSTIYCLFYSDLKRDYYYSTIYCFWFYSFIVFFIPFLSIAILNISIYMRVRKANSERERLSLSQKKEIDVAVVLICIVLAFFCCNILGVVINYFRIHQTHSSLLILIDNFLVPSNSFINLIIYLIFVKKFRHEFSLVFKIRSASRSGHESVSQTNSSTSQTKLTVTKSND